MSVIVKLWGHEAGVLFWDEKHRVADFQYFDNFIATGLDISPLHMPLRQTPYRFVDLSTSDTFWGLPGLIADSLPEKYGNQLLNTWLTRQGRDPYSLNPIERLCYLGSRGMGALEYQPDYNRGDFNVAVSIQIDELVTIAEEILHQRQNAKVSFDGDNLHKLIAVGTSAGGAKAKAIIAWNEQTQEVMSGQASCPPGFSHWLLKFDEVDNEEHATSHNIGRIEMAYHLMAVIAGIDMTECRLMPDGNRAHFMTRRFDRDDAGTKYHIQTLCGLDHADRNPPGMIGYERLFSVARRLGLRQKDLDQLYRRMVFNILARNHDDHSKNHAFMMKPGGQWHLSPAYDICYSYKPGSRWIHNHQMSCNGKRDEFTYADLVEAAKAADIRSPNEHIDAVNNALSYWQNLANQVDVPSEQSSAIQKTFRRISPQ